MIDTTHAPHNHPCFVAGRKQLARFVSLLLSRNGLSHNDMETLARWSAPDEERSQWLAKSQISTIKGEKLPKPGAQIYLALAWMNHRLAELAKPIGKRPPLPNLPPSLQKLTADPGPWFLVNPETGLPCDLGDLFRIYCNELVIPELIEGDDLPRISARDARLACERLALLAQGWMREQQLPSLRASREAVLKLYPQSDPDLKRRMWDVIQQVEELAPEEFMEQREAIRFLVGRLQGGEALSVRQFDRWLAAAE